MMNIKRIFNIRPHFTNKDEIILRDYLALERTRLANERTLLSYIRTALYLLVGGLALIQIEGFENVKWIGIVCFVASAWTFVLGFVRFFKLRDRMVDFYQNPKDKSTEHISH
ncbi:DUF202 domain-containing protein [Penaeicola halotolerans]|uniref:DUF202 domain-containing protein n=1 Tax=Penaeicola halotolerans TaxID=2793196 RepID=UPI001CF87B77|nr:DUF202 domain-containing protein [Penaeicola halotolerans]